VLRIGPELIFGRLWKESGIQEAVQSLLKARRYEFDVERADLTVLATLPIAGDYGGCRSLSPPRLTPLLRP
jgi:hypothetical protein